MSAGVTFAQDARSAQRASAGAPLEIPKRCCAHEQHGADDGQPEQAFDDGADDREHKPDGEQDPDNFQHSLAPALDGSPVVLSSDMFNSSACPGYSAASASREVRLPYGL